MFFFALIQLWNNEFWRKIDSDRCPIYLIYSLIYNDISLLENIAYIWYDSPTEIISYQLKLIKMRAELANLNHCALHLLNRCRCQLVLVLYYNFCEVAVGTMLWDIPRETYPWCSLTHEGPEWHVSCLACHYFTTARKMFWTREGLAPEGPYLHYFTSDDKRLWYCEGKWGFSTL